MCIKRKQQLIALCLLVSTLSGCQQLAQQKSELLRRWNQDYKTSTLIEPLKVPDNLSYPMMTDNYPLPDHLPAPGSVGPVSLVPPGFGEISGQS